MNYSIWKCSKVIQGFTVTELFFFFILVFQINSPRLLPLVGCGKVVQAACGGTQVVVLNGQLTFYPQKAPVGGSTF